MSAEVLCTQMPGFPSMPRAGLALSQPPVPQIPCVSLPTSWQGSRETPCTRLVGSQGPLRSCWPLLQGLT